MNTNSLKKYLIHTWSEHTFKGTIEIRTLPSLHGGSLEITLTVPLRFYVHLMLIWNK